MDIRPCNKDKLQDARLIPLLPTLFLGLWDILRLLCSWEVPMPNMQGTSEVQLVAEGWQVFVI